ncbi:hypothetical protein E6C70_03800 [Glaciibacter flavus]|uniref:Exonuclease domain-containing protein n=1 Tax=Orlajensenia flava TaxID=2565934 RepID=A0A4S4FZJ6_9MICO|nr:NAD(P)H-binding protein [Glaciibacter flavus]THG35196.1 hypothetical protein E6C70_03800 [Glaciibacter flavus]
MATPSDPHIPLIVVLGGTGVAGRAIVADALARGVRVRSVSRNAPRPASAVAGVEYAIADMRSGIGLQEALTDADAIIDASNGQSRAGRRTLTDAPRVVAAAARLAHVHRLVLLSIVNVDRGESGYYRAKAAQEQAYLGSSLDVTVVRATQFHGFVDALVSALPFGASAELIDVVLQPIAVADVARRLVEEALIPRAGERTVTIAGPEVLTGGVLASLHRSARMGRGLIVPVPIPGAFGRFFRSGLAVVPDAAHGSVSYAEWLAGDVGGPAYPDGVNAIPTATWADTLAVFDLETTGVDVDTTRIVTATLAVIGADGGVIERVDWIVDPGIEIPDGAVAVHGITTEHARIYGRVAAEAIVEIVAGVRGHLAAGIPLVAYNAAYDLTVLSREAERYGIPPLTGPLPVIDPYIIDKAVDRYRRGKRTLTATTEHYGVRLDAAHDAGADAIAAGHVAQALARRYPHALAIAVEELHARQVAWALDQAESFQSYMRRERDPEFTTSGIWPQR